jgi:RNA polymerase sigma factor for flagellar operon FliA
LTEIHAQFSYRRRIESDRAHSLADKLDVSDDPLQALAELVAGLALGLMLEGTNLIEPADGVDRRPGPYDTLALRELLAMLAREVGRLPEREAVVIRQHYANGVSFTQIAQLLAISKGRVSQLHASALAKLRTRLGRKR